MFYSYPLLSLASWVCTNQIFKTCVRQLGCFFYKKLLSSARTDPNAVYGVRTAPEVIASAAAVKQDNSDTKPTTATTMPRRPSHLYVSVVQGRKMAFLKPLVTLKVISFNQLITKRFQHTGST